MADVYQLNRPFRPHVAAEREEAREPRELVDISAGVETIFRVWIDGQVAAERNSATITDRIAALLRQRLETDRALMALGVDPRSPEITRAVGRMIARDMFPAALARVRAESDPNSPDAA